MEEDSFKYMEALRKISRRESRELLIEVDDLERFFSKSKEESETDFVYNVEKNSARYLELFGEVVDEIMREEMPQVNLDTNEVADVLLMQRQTVVNRLEEQGAQSQVGEIPKELLRSHEIHLKPSIHEELVPLRKIRSKHVGTLLSTRGIVTRVSDVKPQIVVATYVCDGCAADVFQEVRSKQFTPLVDCPACKGKAVLHMQTRGSKFLSFQSITLQELPEEVPTGHFLHLFIFPKI